MILEQILAATRDSLAARARHRPLGALERDAVVAPRPRRFAAAIAGAPGRLGLIAELKKASPSAGVLRDPFDVEAIAAAYAAGGASALSVLTEALHFQGALASLERAGAAGLPCLQKDFLVSEYQVFEGRAAGADAVLLIAEALDRDRADDLANLALELGMDVLYEAHDTANVRRVIEAAEREPERILVGINNRDLRTFEVHLETSLRVCRDVPPGLLLVAESGIRSAEDVRRLRHAGARGMLVGESLLRATDIEAAVRALLLPLTEVDA
jgi:indole-3-glycerol phosphate synthase